MTRCLIEANQTLGSDALVKTVADKLARGNITFYVVTPRTQVEQEAADWTGGFFAGAPAYLSEETRAFHEQMDALRDAARWRADDRLNLLLQLIRDVGGVADGEVGDADPVAAVKAVLDAHEPFDEILISTLPAAISRWVDMALPEKIAALTDAKITTVHADDNETRA